MKFRILRLKGLSLAMYTLNQLDDKKQDFDIRHIANKFDEDEKFVVSVIEFLRYKMVDRGENGKYSITEQAKLEMPYINNMQDTSKKVMLDR